MCSGRMEYLIEKEIKAPDLGKKLKKTRRKILKIRGEEEIINI